MKKFIAFSLVELLIVLFMVFVVAKITYSIANKPDKTTETEIKLKKTYDLLNDIIIAQNNKKPLYTWGWNKEKADDSPNSVLENYILPLAGKHILCSQFPLNCVGGFMSMDNEEYTNFRRDTSYARAILEDGTHIALNFENKCRKDLPNLPCGTIVIDINNKEGNNRLGEDVFVFDLYSNGSFLPHGMKENEDKINVNCDTNGYGDMCAARIMRDNWKIRYKFEKHDSNFD